MKLRHKFGVVAFIYVASLAANMAVSGYCIVIYFDSAFKDYDTALRHESALEDWRADVSRWVQLALQDSGATSDRQARARIKSQIESRASRLLADPELVLDDEARQQLAEVQARALKATPADVSPASKKLDELLTGAVEHIRGVRNQAVASANLTQQTVVQILIVNGAAGALLCLIGLFLIRRWVLQPVEELRLATREISRGNLAHRVNVRTDDELGHLGHEVNQMSATIVDMQAKLVDTERLAAAGEMVTRVAHNIRNPLAGIRGLAEETAHRAAGDNGVAQNQRRIIESIDRFEQWLRKLQQAVSPVRLQLADVNIEELVQNVSTALEPMADRRGVHIDVQVAPGARHVLIDSDHFEQAVVALMTNAIQASPHGQRVTVSVGSAGESEGKWQLAIEDYGAGVPPEIADRIFEPYFTTKPDGTGLGLAMANKVIRIHGGQMSLTSSPGNGTRFDVMMPGLIPTDG